MLQSVGQITEETTTIPLEQWEAFLISDIGLISDDCEVWLQSTGSIDF